MTAQQYILSPFCALPALEEIYREETNNSNTFSQSPDYQKLKNKNLFLLQEKSRDKLFFINPTTYFFLDAFSEATTLNDVTLKFAEEAGCQPESITNHLANFLEQMLRRKILVPEENYTHLKEIFEMNCTEATSALAPGQRVDDFIIDKTLAIRKTTQLYLVKNIHDEHTTLVMKATFLHPDMPEEVKREIKNDFGKEFRLMKELGEHPSIYKLKDYNDATDAPYAVLEYIEGTSLKNFIKKNVIPLNQKLDLIHEILAVIAFIQDKGVLHGDLHSHNFMVDKNKKIKLIDFGLSNRDNPDEDEILRNGGKSHFIPPERVSMNSFRFLEQRADFTSEVFQLGVLAFFILYEKTPFFGFTWRELAHDIKNNNPVFEEKTPHGEAIPATVKDVLIKAFDKNPSKRYEKAQLMLEAFAGAVV